MTKIILTAAIAAIALASCSMPAGLKAHYSPDDGLVLGVGK